ncbi:MAG: hypothetical protein LBN71_03915, partial [Tannerella sp.]|nr:hypothetical protein [Tannerella sp.]
MKNKLCILVCLMLFAGMAKAEKEVIRIATDQVDLIYRVGENGRLYQAYLGQRLKYDTDIPHLPNIGEAYLT